MNNNKIRNIFICISYGTIIMLTILAGYLLYLSFYPFEIVKLKKFEILDTQIKRGELLRYELDFVKKKNFTSNVKYFLVDGIIIQLEDYGTQRSVGKHETLNARVVPTTVGRGVYKMRIEITYKITAWREVVYVWDSNTFTIL